MSTNLLVRSSKGLVDHKEHGMDDLVDLNELATEAEKLLGYSALNQGLRTQKISVDLDEECRLIRKGLAELDYPPFTNRSVGRYKKAMSWKMLPWIEKVSRLLLLFAIWSLPLWVVVGTTIVTVVGAELWGSVVAFGLAQVTGLLIAAHCCRYSVDKDTLTYFKVEWIVKNIDTYKGKIPEFAVQTALDLKKLFPTVDFRIEELVVMEDKTSLFDKRDPFLQVVLPNGSVYYLEVWNEPGFRGKRMA